MFSQASVFTGRGGGVGICQRDLPLDIDPHYTSDGAHCGWYASCGIAFSGRQVVGPVKKVGKSRNFHQKVGKSRNFSAKK